MRRQDRYTAAGMECYWLSPMPVFVTALKAGARLKYMREWNQNPSDARVWVGA